MRSAADSMLGSEVAMATLANVQAIRQNRKGNAFMVGKRRGDPSPLIVSPDQSSDQAVALADRSREDAPLIAALALHGGGEDACRLHINHHRVDGALVALRVQSHASDDLRAGLFAVLNQGGADGVAGDQVEVHLSGVVN